uniref:Angiotensin-converting enzyme n=1 Tax=Cacopsylla melanoneura TaxID=428564 RepID=A0A8D9AJK0_9HEMI
MLLSLLLVGALACLAASVDPTQDTDGEVEARQFIDFLNKEHGRHMNEGYHAEWLYSTNLTEHNLNYKINKSLEHATFTKEQWKELNKYPWQTYSDPDLRRQFKIYSVLGSPALEFDKLQKFEKLQSDMETIYSTAKVKHHKDKNKTGLSLEPELTEIFIKSRDPEALRHYWTEFRKQSGKQVRDHYKQYVDLENEVAVKNNFTDAAEYWLDAYDTKDFREQVAKLWEQIRPLYLQIHAYVRRRLNEKYGDKHVNRRGPIPAHLLGNMWAQTWNNIYDLVVPYPEKSKPDVTAELKRQGYTVNKMFRTAEEFFTSLNMSAMPPEFWERSVLEKPADRDIVCHASAWDFHDGKDFRIKMCTRVNEEDLFTIHHEMGHVQYFLEYKNQPMAFREGANPGFHEAVGDTISLSVQTPKHLHKIGLLSNVTNDRETTINDLMKTGLEKIAFLPFGYLMDLWRWGVFKKEVSHEDYNKHWWKLRHEYQGVEPPTHRSEDDFDPGAKYHIVASVPYIRYFVSFVIQFQFHRALCIKAGEFDPKNPSKRPLDECDIYRSKEAGNLLKNMLALGSSKPWPEAMEAITGQREMDASALLDYFEPLQKWLEEENARTGEMVGWEPTDKRVHPKSGTIPPKGASKPVRVESKSHTSNISHV